MNYHVCFTCVARLYHVCRPWSVGRGKKFWAVQNFLPRPTPSRFFPASCHVYKSTIARLKLDINAKNIVCFTGNNFLTWFGRKALCDRASTLRHGYKQHGFGRISATDSSDSTNRCRLHTLRHRRHTGDLGGHNKQEQSSYLPVKEQGWQMVMTGSRHVWQRRLAGGRRNLAFSATDRCTTRQYWRWQKIW